MRCLQSWPRPAGAVKGGAASDGMGDPEVDGGPPHGPPSEGTSEGTHYVPATIGPGGTVTYQVDPSASVAGGGCSCQVTVTIAPVMITLTGPVPVSQTYNLAVGQLMTAWVSCAEASASDTFTWGTPGDQPFADYSASATSATFTPFSAISLNASTLSCYFGAPGTTSITCAYYCAELNQQFNLSVPLTVAGPTWDIFGTSCGTMGLVIPEPEPLTWYPWYQGCQTNPGGYLLWGATWTPPGWGDTALTWGIFEMATVQDPVAFLPSGSGQFGWVQTKNRTETINGTQYSSDGLDGGFAYPDFWTESGSFIASDGSSVYHFEDAPGQTGLGPFPFSLTWTGYYSLWLFYMPEADAAGASVYVPVVFIPWSALGQCASPAASGTWSQSDDGSGIGGATSYPAPAQYPIWF